MEFNEKIRALREDNDMTQTNIAKLLNSSQRRISYLEAGTTEPTLNELRKYCKIFKVSADWLIGITNDQ